MKRAILGMVAVTLMATPASGASDTKNTALIAATFMAAREYCFFNIPTERIALFVKVSQFGREAEVMRHVPGQLEIARRQLRDAKPNALEDLCAGIKLLAQKGAVMD